MRAILRWFLIAALGLGVLPAEAQVYPNIPANSLLGRLGAGQAGPPQPIPFATAAQQILSNAGAITNDMFFGSGRPWCDVRAKGAKGDNSTDDSAAFAACVTQMATIGGIIYVPPGNYKVSSGVTITGSIATSLVCAQFNSTEINVGTADVTAVTLNNAPHEIRNCLIQGSNNINTTHDAISIGSNCTECLLDRVYAQYGRYVVNVAGTDVRISNVHLTTAYGGAVLYTTASYSCSACKLDSAYPVSTPGAGTVFAAWQATHSYSSVGTVVSTAGSQAGNTYLIQLVTAGTSGGSAPTLQTYGTNITDGTAVWQLVGQSTYAAAQIDTGSSTVVFSNRSDLSGPYTYGLYLTGNTQTVSFTNSFIGGAYSAGIFQNSSVGGLILTGSQITNCITTSCQGAYLHLGSDSQIIGGTFFGNPVGIELDASVKNYSIVGNEVYGASVAGIFIGGTVSNVSVVGNVLGSSANWGTDAIGVDIATSGTDYITVLGNQCHGATSCISNLSAGTHNLIETTPGIITLNTLTMNGAITAADSGTYGSGGINGSNIGATTPGTGKFSTLTDSGLSTQGVVCNSAAGLLSTSITWCPNATPARNQTLPSNPTGTTSSTPVMAGLSNGVTRFTPVTSGNLLFTISGTAQNSGSGDGCVVIIRYGTGNGPANAASSTGTTAGAPSGQQATSSPAAGNVPFSITAYVTGLTLNTAYYYDLAFNAVTGGTCSLTNITMTAMEM